jgi:hypothetical protein
MSDEPSRRFCGRDFTDRDIARIREMISVHPDENRTGLSRAVCDEFGWMKPDGGRKDMACRVAMLRMQKAGLIDLPEPLTTNSNGRIRPTITGDTDPQPVITHPAGELGSLLFEIVDRRGPSRRWNEFIERYHYLGYKPLPGAQLRYFVHGRDRLLALLGFGAAAWALASRDRFIGWTRDQRIQALHLIVNNARFLIPPWVQSKNLASMILGAAARRIGDDWEVRYGYRPVLLETYVERERHRGTCYRASNWLHLGQTSGRGKLDRTHQPSLPIKDIFVLPLAKDFHRALRSGHCEAVDSSDHRQENFLARKPRTDCSDDSGGLR